MDVIVVGGGLAGMAAAARLGKLRHRVTVVEAADRLGGRWAPYSLHGVPVDDLAPVLTFPAPWRDLFRKCGRSLEDELQRAGLALTPAPDPSYTLPDGTELDLPSDRGGQFRALSQAYGTAPAERWRDLVDSLAGVWQPLRSLGLEGELRGRSQLDPPTRRALRWRESVADLARGLDHPGLAALVQLVAHRLGSDPERTPAFAATQLYVERTFGRWTLGRTSRLIELLSDRLALRRVEVLLVTPVRQVLVESGRVTGVVTTDGVRRADAVVVTVDPWQLYDRLLAHPPRPERRGVRRSEPARSTVVSVRVERLSATPGSDPAAAGVSERTHWEGPDPVTTWCRPAAGALVVTCARPGRGVPDVGGGIAWDGARSWLRRPPIRSALPGLVWAGPHGRGGSAPWATVLAGALASAALQERPGRGQSAPPRP